MDEFELIHRYFSRDKTSQCAVGLGDDCAVLDIPTEKQLVFSMDTLVSGVHFFADDDPELIASRALCVSLSDLAAMGADALCFTLSLSMPQADESWLASFSRGIFKIADIHDCELVGGDTVRGPLVITIQVHGTLPRGAAMKRSGARVGDLVCVSGTLGDGAAALAMLRGELQADNFHLEYLKERYYRPDPRFDVAAIIRPYASAAIDISDGLVADLGHICRASDCGAALETAHIPLSAAVKAVGLESQAQQWALAGGDDYQLCFTISPSNHSAMSKLANAQDISVIGEVIPKTGVYCTNTGMLLSSETASYNHFSAAKKSQDRSNE